MPNWAYSDHIWPYLTPFDLDWPWPTFSDLIIELSIKFAFFWYIYRIFCMSNIKFWKNQESPDGIFDRSTDFGTTDNTPIESSKAALDDCGLKSFGFWSLSVSWTIFQYFEHKMRGRTRLRPLQTFSSTPNWSSHRAASFDI